MMSRIDSLALIEASVWQELLFAASLRQLRGNATDESRESA